MSELLSRLSLQQQINNRTVSMRRLLFLFAFVIFSLVANADKEEKEGKSKHRAARVISTAVYWNSNGSHFKDVFLPQIDFYFSNSDSWGLNSLSTLQMHLAQMHYRQRRGGRAMDTKKIKILFAALLPLGIDDVVVSLLKSFCLHVLGELNDNDVDDMLDAYLYVHHDKAVTTEILEAARVDTLLKPEKSIYSLLERFQQLYPRSKLLEYFQNPN